MVIDQLLESLPTPVQPRQLQLIRNLLQTHLEDSIFPQSFVRAFQLLQTHRLYHLHKFDNPLPYLQFTRLLTRYEAILDLVQPPLFQYLASRDWTPESLHQVLLITQRWLRKQRPGPRSLIQLLKRSLQNNYCMTVRRGVIIILFLLKKPGEKDSMMEQFSQLSSVTNLLTVLHRFACKKEVLSIFVILLKSQMFLQNFLRLDGVGMLIEIASIQSYADHDSKTAALNFLQFIAEINQLSYQMKNTYFLQHIRAIISSTPSFMHLRLACTLLTDLALDDKTSLAIVRVCGQAAIHRLITLVSKKDEFKFDDVSEDQKLKANFESCTALAKLLRYTYAIDKNKQLVKSILPAKLLGEFIDINNYTKPVAKYQAFVNNIYLLSDIQIQAILANLNQRRQYMQQRLASYLVHEQIGKGSFGIVYRCTKNHQEFALKRMPVSQDMEKDTQDRYQNEIRIHKDLTHPHIVRFVQSFVLDDALCIVMDYVRGFNLHELVRLKREKARKFKQSQIWQIAIGLLSVLHFLHEKNYVHNDINPSNILIDQNGKPKLVDFGLCQTYKEASQEAKTFAGTVQYSSPERISLKACSHKSDIWSFGCTIYQLIQLQPPFQNNPSTISKKIINREYAPLTANYSQQLINFVEKCLLDQRNRPSASAMIKQCLNQFLKYCSDLIVQNSLLQSEMLRQSRLSGRGLMRGHIIVEDNLKEVENPLDKYLQLIAKLKNAPDRLPYKSFRREALILYLERTIFSKSQHSSFLRGELQRILGQSQQTLRSVSLKSESGKVSYRNLWEWISE